MNEIKFLHIGHHRCGSSFLQSKLFPSLENWKILDPKSRPEFKSDFIYLARTADIYYEQEPFESEFKEKIKGYDGLSYAGFVGHGPESTGGHHIKGAAERLARLAPNANVLMVIRRQQEFVQSWYAAEVKSGVVGGFERWARQKEKYGLLDWCKYGPIIRLYQDLFGKDRVHVLAFEEMFDRERLGRVLIGMGLDDRGLETVNLGQKVNRSMSGLGIRTARQANRFFGGKHNSGNGRLYYHWRRNYDKLDRVFFGLGAKTANLDFKGFDELMAEVYGKDNLALESLTGLDLAAHGYPMERIGATDGIAA